MSSFLLISADAPVAKNNRHVNFGRFVKLEQPELEASFVLLKIYIIFS